MSKGLQTLDFSFEAESLTHFGGLFLIQRFCNKLCLRRRLERILRSPPNWVDYPPADLVLVFLYVLIAGLARVNKTLPPEARVQRFVLLPKEFDADEGELTRTRKLKRQFLQARYRDLIDSIYDGKSEVPMVSEVKYRDGRKGQVSTSLRVRSVYAAGGGAC